jgi:hypothetical protein
VLTPPSAILCHPSPLPCPCFLLGCVALYQLSAPGAAETRKRSRSASADSPGQPHQASSLYHQQQSRDALLRAFATGATCVDVESLWEAFRGSGAAARLVGDFKVWVASPCADISFVFLPDLAALRLITGLLGGAAAFWGCTNRTTPAHLRRAAIRDSIQLWLSNRRAHCWAAHFLACMPEAGVVYASQLAACSTVQHRTGPWHHADIS